MPLVAIFAWIAAFFGKEAKNLGFNLAKYAAYLAFVVFSVGALLVATNALIDGIKVAMPITAINVWGWFMPSNAVGCLLAIVSARFLRAIYDFKVNLAKAKLDSVRSS